jgi:hypothetical protein
MTMRSGADSMSRASVRQSRLLAIGLLLAMLLFASGHARAFVGSGPIFTRTFISQCSISSVRARLDPDGVTVRYWVDGACPGGRVSAVTVFRSGVFNENFDLGASGTIRTKGTCSDNPWIKAARCDDVMVRGEGNDVEQLLAQHPYSPEGNVTGPLTSYVGGALTWFTKAQDAAERPNPPNAPAGVRVTHPLGTASVRLTWFAPDESGDRPYLHFLVQARPRAVDGAAWIELGKIKRAGEAAYSTSLRLPLPLAGSDGWDIRMCSATMLATTCGAAQTPTSVAPTSVADKLVLPAPKILTNIAPTILTNIATSTCERAANAKIRNSPAAAALAAKCSAEGGEPKIGPVIPDLDVLAQEGETLASADALATFMRESLAEGAVQRGFDIAMAAIRDQTEWGPRKQKILDALNTESQTGFKAATSYLLDRNRYAERARLGATIAQADEALELKRSSQSDARYRLGFDIATAIFGDRAKGAQGNTAPGPGSLGIRNSLSEPAQRGFDAAMYLHLSRTN